LRESIFGRSGLTVLTSRNTSGSKVWAGRWQPTFKLLVAKMPHQYLVRASLGALGVYKLESPAYLLLFRQAHLETREVGMELSFVHFVKRFCCFVTQNVNDDVGSVFADVGRVNLSNDWL
jgi:hypothetical protein